MEVILKIIGTPGGAISTALSIYNFVRRKEAPEQREKEEAKKPEERNWKFFAQSLKSSRKGYILIPENGSEDHKRAVRFVAKGIFERSSIGRGYAVPGQQFLMG